jgi:quinol monooxygenase YgiN
MALPAALRLLHLQIDKSMPLAYHALDWCRAFNAIFNKKRRRTMIHVIASVRVKPGKRDEFIALFKSILPKVREEQGCVRYLPAIDIATGLPPQELDENLVTIIETWDSVDALQNHLGTPHMAAYFEKEKPLVEGSILKILQEA